MSNTSYYTKAQCLALELALAILDEIDDRSRQGVTDPLPVELQAHLVGLVAERHGLQPAEIEAMLRECAWAIQETQRMADGGRLPSRIALRGLIRATLGRKRELERN